MKTLLFVGLINHQHIQNFANSIKRNLGYSLLGLNTNPNYLKENNLSNSSSFDEVLDVPRYNLKVRDFLSKLFSPILQFLKFKQSIDIVQFHFVSYFVLPLLIAAKLKRIKTSCFVYGSDFLRADTITKMYLNLTFSLVDSIVCDSSSLQEELVDRYPQYKDKCTCVLFGSIIIDKLIDNNNDRRILKESISDNKEQRIIMCGYNGNSSQNHLRIIDSLETYVGKAFCIFPMTYGASETYINTVRKVLNEKKFSYLILDKFLTDSEWIKYILSTEVFIHMQESDAFSSTIAEQLLIGNIVINADWLKYIELDNAEVYYENANFKNLEEKVDNILSEMTIYKNRCVRNKEKIVKMKSLDYCVKHYWSNYFSELC